MSQKTPNTQKIYLIGYGTMGKAMADAWIQHNVLLPDQLVIVNKEPISPPYPAKISDSFECLASAASQDFVLFAVRPQDMTEVMEQIPATVKETPLLIGSVAAGVPLSYYAHQFSPKSQLVRFMPNLGIRVQQGVTGGYTNQQLTPHQQQFIEQLFSACGMFFWVKKEADLDMVTAFSGSGPGYVFYLADTLSKLAHDKLGISAEQAQDMVFHLLQGSLDYAALYAKENANTSVFKELWEDMTRIKGTTHAGVEALQKDNLLEKVIDQAIQAAHTKSVALSKTDNN